MDTLVIQVGLRHGRMADITRSQNGLLSVGRAFDNTLVLTDMHVAAHQIRLENIESEWYLWVLDETNPVLLNGDKVGNNGAKINAGDEITVGRTRLFVYPENYEVEPTRKLMLSNWLSGERVNPLLPVALFLFVSLFDFLYVYLDSSVDLNWEPLVSEQLFGALIVLAWVSIWAFIGRLLRHQHHFGLQVMATVGTLFMASLLFILAEYVSYPFHSPLLEDVLLWIVGLFTLLVLVRLNLMIASNLHRPGWVASIVTLMVGGLIYGFSYFSGNPGYHVADYSTELKAPVIGLYKGDSLDSYFAELENQLRQQGDER